MAITFTVTTRSGSLNIRTGAGAKYKSLGGAPKGATVTTVSDVPVNNWYHIKYGSLTGWCFGGSGYLTKVASTPETTTPVETTAASVSGVDNTENRDSAANVELSQGVTVNVRREHWKAIHAMGCPPMYNQNVDMQYIDDIAPGVGRVFASTMLSNPTILSLCPGRVQYLPGFSNKTKDDFMQFIIDSAKNTDISNKVNDSFENKLNGKLFEFKSDFADYCKIFNLLCRMTAIILGIGDNFFPRTTINYKSYDYAYITQTDDAWNGQENNNASNKFTIFKQGVYALKKGLTTAVEDNNYMHYFVTNQGTSVSESASTDTQPTFLENILGNGESGAFSSLSHDAEFLLSGTNYEAVQNDIAQLTKNSDGYLGSFANIFANYLRGGRLVMPQMISDVKYEKSISCTCKFVSPYGNKESIFLRCYVPLMSIMAMALPKQIADNMYTYPFLIRAFQKGFFNSDLAVITSLQVTRGGSDDTAWTIDGLSTELEVRFDVTPLYSRLMVTSADNPILFFKNTSLIEYLGTICGMDFKINNLKAKEAIVIQAIGQKFSFQDGVDNIGRTIGDVIENSVGKFIKFLNL
jgi:uncharacterized protein YraI